MEGMTLIFVYLFLAVLGLCCCTGFALVVARGGYSLVGVRGLLITVASPVSERGLQSTRTSVVGVRGLISCGAQAAEHKLSCGVWAYLLLSIQELPGPGTEPGSPALAGRFFTTEVPGKPLTAFRNTSLNLFKNQSNNSQPKVCICL